ncbi:MAG: c-type cytochrome [Caulobacterales bacterium]|nr:c-type cytochrome [Caulobacterales bacterium]
MRIQGLAAAVSVVGVGLAGAAALLAAGGPAVGAAAAKAGGCGGDNGGLSLPPGFCATVFADDLGHVRQLTVAPNGVVYANIWSGRYYPSGGTPEGGFLVALQDTNGDGVADKTSRFGLTAAEGSAGGTGVAVYKGYVYAEMNDKIVRYALPAGGTVPAGKPQTVLSGMPLGGDHPMHPFIIDAKGALFVDMGSATNACQPKNRVPGVAGAEPCTETETRAGIWKYDANRLDQAFSPRERFATGLRNAEGLAIDTAGRLFATQHGRDQLIQNWPKLYPDAKAATDLPAEELVVVKAGADYGWPRCYYDGAQKKLVLAPEYGGDGGKAVGGCAGKSPPVAAFPGHWAPNALALYNAKGFPAAYQGGAFIAFHGSWNRAPEPQGGFNVVFQPLRDGKASGPWSVFADGFGGPGKALGRAAHRPMGVAVAPDGALYISDDVKGRIWRVTYRGAPGAAVAAAAPPSPEPEAKAAPAASAAPPPTPPGATAEQVAAGDKLFHSSTCAACHGADAKGTALGPDLTAGTWLWSDGALAALRETIQKGVPAPKRYRSPMPPMGGAQLSDADLSAVAAYVWAVGHKAP